MHRSTDRILTTHCGSLPRPADLLDVMKARAEGREMDADSFLDTLRKAVEQTVEMQLECGIDIVSDGEQSKTGFFSYINERLTGFEKDSEPSRPVFAEEREAFPEYYEQYFEHAMIGGAIVPPVPMVCTSGVSYVGFDELERDIDNLRDALAGRPYVEAFMAATAPGRAGRNGYYDSDEAFAYAVAEAMQTEYEAIAAAGFVLQVDDPFLTDIFGDTTLTAEERLRAASINVEALNHALRNIPMEQVRFHTCYGINEGPRIHDAPLRAVVASMLAIDAGAYSFEAANPRHEHEYKVWADIALPEGKVLIPGVITHGSNIVEHPELIADRIERYAELVGRESVIAGADCGFSSQATYHPEVDPRVIREKFAALAEGARIATARLWPGR